MTKLYTAFANEFNNAVENGMAETPITNAFIVVQEDVRQDTITPIQGAKLLSEVYQRGGAEALDRLYNHETGNLHPNALERAKQYSTSAGEVTKGKASRENTNHLIYNFNGFVSEGKEITLSDNIKARIASAIKSGNGILSKSRRLGRVYLSENTNFYIFSFNEDGSVTIEGMLDSDIDGEYISIVEEVIKNDGNRKRSGEDLSRYLERFRNGQGYTNNNIGSIASSLRSDAQTDAVYSRSSNDNSGRGREAGSKTNQNQIVSHLPVKHSFVDIAGRRRNVLGISNGQYMVQDTKKTNYKFNSIEDAISAENENIIKRYANKSDRTVTWVKNKLLEDSDFLVKEARRGKASRELDLDYMDAVNRGDMETVERIKRHPIGC